MSWSELSPELRELLQERLTPRELDYVKLKAANPKLGGRALAVMLGVSHTRVRDLEQQVQRKLADLSP